MIIHPYYQNQYSEAYQRAFSLQTKEASLENFKAYLGIITVVSLLVFGFGSLFHSTQLHSYVNAFSITDIAVFSASTLGLIVTYLIAKGIKNKKKKILNSFSPDDYFDRVKNNPSMLKQVALEISSRLDSESLASTFANKLYTYLQNKSSQKELLKELASLLSNPISNLFADTILLMPPSLASKLKEEMNSNQRQLFSSIIKEKILCITSMIQSHSYYKNSHENFHFYLGFYDKLAFLLESTRSTNKSLKECDAASQREAIKKYHLLLTQRGFETLEIFEVDTKALNEVSKRAFEVCKKKLKF